ncbi:LexA family transcriptional regulator [Pelagerythrobacter marinus]|uniref:LexA family transcriptional regulator n=1 Tax=Pelagerythrobacter marinus TaxID=538382 RepID=UPI002AC9071E|nr:S24 family peptidase [Pelagerythrobacter marinus]WPZ06612.1 S24 family peptidase [Pelagerythrobacter marinus]
MSGFEQDTELLRRLVDTTGLTPAAIAKRAGLAVTTINRSYNGTATTRLSQPTLEKLRANFPDVWAEISEGARAGHDPDDVEIDNIDLSYGMGGTFLDVGDADVEKVKFSRRWLRRFTHAPPEDLGSTEGIGDSMEPVISDRDIVIFDRSARLEDHLSDKMWVFAYGHIGMIKRLRPMPDGTVKIMSANRTYPDEIATGDELHIIGRVVATVRRH